MITIVDTGLGNFRSVANAFEAIGHKTIITDDLKAIQKAERIVMPGVGNYAEGIRLLKEKKLIEVLKEEVLGKKKPLLGICLGMQLLSSKGTEGGNTEGLNFIPADTVILENQDQQVSFRLPHVGWNEVSLPKNSKLFRGIPEGESFYFIHSYHFKPKINDEAVAAYCHYGQRFAAAIEKENIAAVQFHPEKSHKAGLKLLQNFAENF